MSTPTKRPTMYHSVDQVASSGLLSAERVSELLADIERRIERVYDAEKRLIQNAFIACFPNGDRMLYTRAAHDPQNTYARRELLASLLTDDEINLINDLYHTAHCERQDAERFAKAQHIDEANWSGSVFWGDQWYDSLEAFWDVWVSDHCNWDSEQKRFVLGSGDDEVEVPRYVWAAQSQAVIPSLDVGDIVDHWVCDRGWEDMGTNDLNGLKELQQALDDFVQANSPVVSYAPDWTKAIILDSKGLSKPE